MTFKLTLYYLANLLSIVTGAIVLSYLGYRITISISEYLFEKDNKKNGNNNDDEQQ